MVIKNIINNYKFLFNYHNADLPSQRGAACHSWGIMMNKKDSSLNMHLISEKFDTGKIIYNQKYKLNNYLSNLNSIYRKINKEEKFFLINFLKNFSKKLYTKSQMIINLSIGQNLIKKKILMLIGTGLQKKFIDFVMLLTILLKVSQLNIKDLKYYSQVQSLLM